MLQIVPIENRSQINELFAKYNPREQSWLVSDLRTKFELQQKILARDGQYVDESVLRASDLWKLLLKRLEPRLRLVSNPFARSILRTILDENAEALGVNSSAEDTVFSYIDQLAAIIFHPEGTQKLNDWFDEHPEAKNRWGAWYLRARFCAIQLLEKYNIITAGWITSYLQNFNDLERVWDIPLIVDLSGEISRVEAEILRTLSRTIDVVVLEPTPTWRDEFKYLLRPYEDLRGQSSSIKKLQPAAPVTKTKEVLRFSGMLAEIKNSVGQVRKWLEAGIPADNIAVIAPDIEQYWPVLQAFLKEEGIPVQKDITHKIQSLPSATRWLATLRAKSGRLSSSDLEISFFEKHESQALRYEDFKALFKSLYVNEDLARNELIHKIYFEQIDLSGPVVRDEFVGKALSFWSSSDTEVVQIVLRELLQNATANTKLIWKEWLSYLESIVAAKEYSLEKGESSGVLVTKLMSAYSEKARYRIFVGLTDESLKSRNKTQLSGSDYFDLAKDIGFYLDNPDQSDLAFELRLLAEADSVHDIYCFGGTDLSGTLCSPSTFWMSLNEGHAHETLTVPMETRWDEIQYSKQGANRTWIDSRKAEIEHKIQLDLGKADLPLVELKKLPSISASAIESYLECPFIFAAQRYFKLKDLPEVDLDVDHRTRGQLAHALFEKLTQEPMRFDWQSAEIEEILESVRKDKNMLFADERLWLPLRKKHVQLAQRFLDFEKTWRQEYNLTKTLAREKRFEFYLDPKSETLSKEASDGAFRISGSIDRVDTDQDGHLVLLDYKSSAGGISAHGSWLKNHELQLLFYMWVIEKSLMEEMKGEVIGLFYYIFRTFDRKGFRVNDKAGRLYPATRTKDKNATLEAKELYLTEFSKILLATLERIRLGEIRPAPVDTQICTSCEWRRQCRAPHLN
ncbi:PD-(D/E)XK nuclease family protein [Bdellovibrio sp. ZAP7]|uniref:PD-(D/E)XK nuclease family protein n=1 Tax=Bdellovibrio sp. ZAP7 TaxID=2231053 RepID=UPI001159B06B|nr:PD-(D/E)XK nuclease family protein [Bdellovibrio sp. ZAP7]QDK44276.1 PD-(D/E)XK nuclease family protein [Bdellovibrio sp. ZAP7]